MLLNVKRIKDALIVKAFHEKQLINTVIAKQQHMSLVMARVFNCSLQLI